MPFLIYIHLLIAFACLPAWVVSAPSDQFTAWSQNTSPIQFTDDRQGNTGLWTRSQFLIDVKQQSCTIADLNIQLELNSNCMNSILAVLHRYSPSQEIDGSIAFPLDIGSWMNNEWTSGDFEQCPSQPTPSYNLFIDDDSTTSFTVDSDGIIHGTLSPRHFIASSIEGVPPGVSMEPSAFNGMDAEGLWVLTFLMATYSGMEEYSYLEASLIKWGLSFTCVEELDLPTKMPTAMPTISSVPSMMPSKGVEIVDEEPRMITLMEDRFTALSSFRTPFPFTDYKNPETGLFESVTAVIQVPQSCKIADVNIHLEMISNCMNGLWAGISSPGSTSSAAMFPLNLRSWREYDVNAQSEPLCSAENPDLTYYLLFDDEVNPSVEYIHGGDQTMVFGNMSPVEFERNGPGQDMALNAFRGAESSGQWGLTLTLSPDDMSNDYSSIEASLVQWGITVRCEDDGPSPSTTSPTASSVPSNDPTQEPDNVFFYDQFTAWTYSDPPDQFTDDRIALTDRWISSDFFMNIRHSCIIHDIDVHIELTSNCIDTIVASLSRSNDNEGEDTKISLLPLRPGIWREQTLFPQSSSMCLVTDRNPPKFRFTFDDGAQDSFTTNASGNQGERTYSGMFSPARLETSLMSSLDPDDMDISMKLSTFRGLDSAGSWELSFMFFPPDSSDGENIDYVQSLLNSSLIKWGITFFCEKDGTGNWYSKNEMCVRDCAIGKGAYCGGVVFDDMVSLYEDPLSCCDGEFDGMMEANSCKVNAGIPIGTNMWYRDDTQTKCVRDCPLDLDNDNMQSYCGGIDTAGHEKFQGGEECCEEMFYEVTMCKINSGVGGSKRWFVDIYRNGGQCRQDCLMSMSEPYCGGLAPREASLYDTAEECCRKIPWNEASCLANSGVVSTHSITNKWYNIERSVKCVKDCPVDDTDPNSFCGGSLNGNSDIVELYDDADECCAGNYGRDFVECKRNSGIVGSNKWYVDWTNFETPRCLQDCMEGYSTEPRCGGLTESLRTRLYDDAEECCTRSYEYGLRTCKYNSGLDVVGSKLWYPLYDSSGIPRCVQDCVMGNAEERCEGFAMTWQDLYESCEICYEEELENMEVDCR